MSGAVRIGTPGNGGSPVGEAALQGRHAVAAVLVDEVQLERVLAGLGGMRLEADDEDHRRVDEREIRDVDRVELAQDVELPLARDVGRVTEDCEIDIHAITTAPHRTRHIAYLPPTRAPRKGVLVSPRSRD